MKSKVFFANSRQHYGKNLFSKLDKLFKKLEPDTFISRPDLVAIKIHWGEAGNLAYVPAQVTRHVADHVKRLGGRPFVTDTNTLYSGSRRNAVDNIMTAIENGFAPSVIGAPVIVADGLCGHDYVNVKVKGKNFKSVKIASAVHHADAMIVISHVKGHMAVGMGGTIKNLSMGCAAPSGKQNMHSDIKPKVEAKKCVSCGACIRVCPVGAATGGPKLKSTIDEAKCIGCGECVVVCRYGAIEVNWESDMSLLQEKIAEYALGAVQNKKNKCAFFNFITNVTPDCDCCNWNDLPFAPDIGVLASRDPVAIDQAAGDLVNAAPWINASSFKLKRPNETDKFMALHGTDWRAQIHSGQALGLGSADYELVEVK